MAFVQSRVHGSLSGLPRWSKALTHGKPFTSTSALQTHPVVYHPDFQLSPLPTNHRFPMPKDTLLYQRLVEEGLANHTFTPTYPDVEDICLVHDKGYVTDFIEGRLSSELMRQIGLPWSTTLVRRTLIGTGSAILATRLALQYGVACMCNGGTHHAHRDYGTGWCVFNDLAVGARAAQRDIGVEKVLFVDLDVHQGDGTATIFAEDPSVFTLSIHCHDQGFPHVVRTSDRDVGLPAGTGDQEYMQVLTDTLPQLLHDFKPNLVMYNAGVDVHVDDALGKLALTTGGIQWRDDYVLGLCARAGIPVACAIGGGYEEDHSHIVERHLCLHRAATRHLSLFLENMFTHRSRTS